MTKASTSTKGDLEKRWHDLCWGVQRSVRYHERRQAYYIRVNSMSTAVSLVFGTSAFGLLVKGHEAIAMVCSLLVALFSLFNMVTRASEMSRRHEALRQRWCDLQARMDSSKITEDSWRDFRTARLEIEKDEPPVQRIIDAICNNDLLMAKGYDPNDPEEARLFREVPLLYSLSGNLIPWDAARLKCRSASAPAPKDPLASA